MNQIRAARLALWEARAELELTPEDHPVYRIRAAKVRVLQEDLLLLIDAESDGGTRAIPADRR
jgi:hypothetical protein